MSADLPPALADALRRLRDGDLELRLPGDPAGGPADELASLFNEVAGSFSLLFERARRARELEELVEERTGQLRRSEEGFRRLFDAAPVPMVLVEMDSGDIRSCNLRAQQLLALRGPDAAGRAFVDLFDLRAEGEHFLSDLRRDGAVRTSAVRIAPRQGPPFWTLLQASAIELQDGPVVVVSFADLTEQKETEARLRELATMDALTGTINRRHFLAMASEEIERASRYGRPVCLALLDVDHFKPVNDRFGHATGDEALRLVAATLQRQLRQQDLLGRYGGEEFAMVLPETTLEGARAVLERSRLAVESAALVHGGQRVAVTVSAGLVAWTGGESLEEALRRADEALHAAKNAGRNRVATS